MRIGVGLRQSCEIYPNSITAVNRFAQSVVDSLHYTSFVILDNNLAKEHKDSQNAHLPNVVVPLSAFSGGDIVVNVEGQEVFLKVSQGPVSFCAREHAHHVTPFQGRRVILVLFSLRGCLHLSKDDRACLIRLGFPLPSAEALSSRVAPLPKLLFDPDGPAKGSPMLGCNSLKHQGPRSSPGKGTLPRPKPQPPSSTACGAMCRFRHSFLRCPGFGLGCCPD